MKVQFDGVTVLRDGRPVIDTLSLTLAERRIGLIGLNGSGKSTFLRLINGLVLPDRGTVAVDHLATRDAARAIRRRVGFLFQDADHQIVFPIIEEDLAFGLANYGISGADAEQRIAATMTALGIKALAGRRIHELSGGERQSVALAGVLVMAPELILFDEPTASLDIRQRRTLGRMLDSLPQQVILATHDLDFLASFERVLVLDQGRIVEDGLPGHALSAYRDRLEC